MGTCKVVKLGNHRILQGDVMDALLCLADESVHCVVTSPPYWRLRDYGVDGQIGLEKHPSEYVNKLVQVCREIHRVLRKEGTFWLNLGDSYASKPSTSCGYKDGRNNRLERKSGGGSDGMKPKTLFGIPWRVAFALQESGWHLRSEIIWEKPNCMTESMKDRPTRSHEHIFLFTKQERYFYDAFAVREKDSGTDHRRTKLTGQSSLDPSGGLMSPHKGIRTEDGRNGMGRNRRTVWRVPVVPYKGAHFAAYPPKLIEPCILAGTSAKGVCSECGAPWVRQISKERKATRPGNNTKVLGSSQIEGNRDPQRHVTSYRTVGWNPSCKCENNVPIPATVLDPFGGSMTTGEVAIKHGRRFVGIELNPAYIKLGVKRLRKGEAQRGFGLCT